MPDSPVAPGASAPGSGGSGVTEAIVGIDAGLAKLAKASAENPEIPDGAKASIQAALDAFRAFTDELTGGSEAAPEPEAGQVPAMAGARGVPMSHGRPA